MAKKIADPVEAAKLQAEGYVPPMEAVAAQAPAEEKLAVKEQVAEAPRAPSGPRLLVVKAKKISWYGSMTTVAEGSDVTSWSEADKKRLRDCGIELAEK